jgi:hypothetical protein
VSGPGSTRIGESVLTVSGVEFYPLDPRAADVNIQDIAHALAYSTRFNGHASDYYSIAEHCVHASYECDLDDALEGLMHDAAEYVVGDLVSPVRRMIYRGSRTLEGCSFDDVERAVERVVADKFRLRYDDAKAWPWPESVRRADLAVLAAEKRDLFPEASRPWKSLVGVEPMRRRVECWSPAKSRMKFLARFYELYELRLARL